MKKRTLSYFSKIKAARIFQNPLEADLTTFLKATFELSRNRIVKNHIQDSIKSLEKRIENPAAYRLSA